MAEVSIGQRFILGRLTDLPRPQWWGSIIRCVKSLETLLFKLFEWLSWYKAEKSIVMIPSLATSIQTTLSAVVYNGRCEEVLGFRPRRFLHRLIRGVPDVELYETLRFQVKIMDDTPRLAEGNTETRGFVQLNIPWHLPPHGPTMCWPRVEPLGVDTLFGRIKLGDYEIYNAPLFFLHSGVKSILISDIDDTIKLSNIAEATSFKSMVAGLFKGNYYKYDAIIGMAELYQKLSEKGFLILYVTSTPYQLAPFLLKFLRTAKFPEGPVFLRWLGHGKKRHKWRVLYHVLSVATQPCYLLGDSGEFDLQVYRRASKQPSFANKIERIMIRHVPGTSLPKLHKPKEFLYSKIEELESEMLSFK